MDITIPNFYLESDRQLNEICRPLQDYGIYYFSYLHHYEDGTQSYFSNHSQWVWDYYHLSLYQSSLFALNPKQYKTGYYVWPHAPELDVFSHGIQLLNSGNGITYIDTHPNSTEFYFFSGLTTDKWLTNFYINNLALISNFIYTFKTQAENLLLKAKKHRIIMPDHHQRIITDKLAEIILPSFFSNNDLPEHTKHSNPQYKIIKLKFPDLSTRELDIIACLSRGESAKMTARSLSISNRTVEKHLENIKMKLSCRSKSEIVGKVLAEKFF